MRAFIIVGATGTGKTHFVREHLKKVHPESLLIFDVNNEWQDLYPHPFNDDLDIFLEKAYRARNAIILVEDATSFLSTRGRSDLLVKILVAKRHTKNTIFLLFHSFADIPKYIFTKCTHVVIFKTNDSKDRVKTNFDNDDLTKAWEEVQANAKTNPFFSTYPPPKGTTPPFKIFSVY